MLCPICKFEVSNQRGLASHFRQQAKTHPDYNTWIENEKWSNKISMADYVTCLECGFKSESLARHLKAVHNISASDYKNKYGDASLIRATKLTQRRKLAAKNRDGGFGKGDTKIITCPKCKTPHEVSKFFSLIIHNPLCYSCQESEEILKWENLSEPQDFVSCLECSYRAENLTSHINNSHSSYREKHPHALIVSLKSSIRDSSYKIGTHQTDETKKKMSENAGKWNLGLTKETDGRVAKISEQLIGKTAWNKGETSKTNLSVARTLESLKKFYSENDKTWDNGLKANLTLEDFKPFMDSEGRVDHFAVIEATGLNWVTVHKYIKELSLEKTKRYFNQRVENQLTKIDKEILLRYSLQNGKIFIGKVIAELGYSYKVVKRECQRHNLKTFTRSIRQASCLNVVAKVLNDLFYIPEWQSTKFKNPKTGYRFKFDGYFPEIGLVVEFHGHQHYIYPNIYHKTEEEYLIQRERDKVKEEMVRANPNLKFFKVQEDEPFDNGDYIRGRLVESGILESF